MRYLTIAAILFAVTCNSTPPVIVVPTAPTERKLWNTPEERNRFMLKMTHHLVAPIRDECIDRVLDKLNRKEAKQAQSFDERTLIGFSPLMAQAKPAAPAAGDSCSTALQSCGTCHLPRKNNCNYRITLKDKGEFTGKVIAEGEKLTFKPNGEEAAASDIAPNEIVRTEWLNGGDDITTWWNFKKLGGKSRIVKKMMSMAEKNNVGCTNCHMQHGNFSLNENGKHFDQTGEIKRIVSIADFLK